MEFFYTDYIALFLILCIGFIIGNIRINGISMDSSAIIFVALFFGHIGVHLPEIIGTIGLVLFIYTIGIQNGAGFFDVFKEQGKKLIVLSFIIVFSAALISLLSMLVFDVEVPVAIGLLSGSLTSTPGLAAAIDVTNSPLASIGYGIAYPFGVIGVILFVRLIPRILKIDIKKSEEEYEAHLKTGFNEILHRNFVVENINVIGKSIEDLRIRSITNAIVSRVMHEGEAIVPNRSTILYKNDLIKVVGTEEALKRTELLIGSSTNMEIPLGINHTVQSVLVTNKEVVNRPIGEFNLTGSYNANITRVRRSGIDLAPTPNLRIQFGDKLMVAGEKENMKLVIKLFGNNDKKLSDTDFFPIVTGIVLGVLLGHLSISFGNNFTFNLGLTGGILIVSMILSRIGKTGKILWTMSGTANQLLRQLGLMFFLAAVGTHAGATMVDTFKEYGFQIFAIGATITLVPMLVALLIGQYVFKFNILSMLGAVTGSMTSTPGLAAIHPMTESNAPSVAYAAVYPFAMVLLIICVQLLGLLL